VREGVRLKGAFDEKRRVRTGGREKKSTRGYRRLTKKGATKSGRQRGRVREKSVNYSMRWGEGPKGGKGRSKMSINRIESWHGKKVLGFSSSLGGEQKRGGW